MNSLRTPLTRRMLVIGNSGSGKSTFAKKISNSSGIPVIDLDELHWIGGSYGEKRPKEIARRLVCDVSAGDRWIIEGVFGWLAEIATIRTTELVWLDLPWEECRLGLLERGQRRGANSADFGDLLAWAQAYWTRTTSSSFTGHQYIFASFPGLKLRLESRQAVDQFFNEEVVR